MDQLAQKAPSSSSKGAAQVMLAQDFTAQIEKLSGELNKCWAREDKVATMRIAIQCTKLLNDVATPIFYPQKFILLTDILDEYGKLVLGRMRHLTKMHSGGKIIIDDNTDMKDFDWSTIPPQVQVICQHWFLKTACIREVVPRIYLDLALLSCMNFQ